MHACADGSGLVCDSIRGLPRADPSGVVETLLDEDYSMVTSVIERSVPRSLGSLHESAIAVTSLP